MSTSSITHQQAAQAFHEQLQFALSSYKTHDIGLEGVHSIVIAGLGGSGIGGRLAKSVYTSSASVPIEVVSGYDLPAFVNENTLVILCSYSGNTEETLTMLEVALDRNSKCLALSTGGALKAKAAENSIPFYELPTGYQPRMALGFSFGLLILILNELFGEAYDAELEECVEFIKSENSKALEKAQGILAYFDASATNKYVFVAGEKYEPIALRACQQMQENGKSEGFYHTLPECNHNVTESYYGTLPSNIVFIEGETHPRTVHRFRFLEDLLKTTGNKVISLNSEHDGLKGMFYLILTLDWLSIIHSEKLGKDNMQVQNIDKLKQFLTTV